MASVTVAFDPRFSKALPWAVTYREGDLVEVLNYGREDQARNMAARLIQGYSDFPEAGRNEMKKALMRIEAAAGLVRALMFDYPRVSEITEPTANLAIAMQLLARAQVLMEEAK